MTEGILEGKKRGRNENSFELRKRKKKKQSGSIAFFTLAERRRPSIDDAPFAAVALSSSPLDNYAPELHPVDAEGPSAAPRMEQSSRHRGSEEETTTEDAGSGSKQRR